MPGPEGETAADGGPAAVALGNPYLEAWKRTRGRAQATDRDVLVRQFGLAVPDERVLRLIERHAPRGVLELGAGTGYWARLLHDRGIDVVAYDIAPPPSAENRWFAGQPTWHPVRSGDEHVVADHPERTLLLVWPTRNEDWAATAADMHLRNGGQRLIYVGEPPGGRTGDLRLHAVLGLVGRCLACAYDLDSVPCTCSVSERWRLVAEVELPRWQGHDDQLFVFEPDRRMTGKWRRRWRRA